MRDGVKSSSHLGSGKGTYMNRFARGLSITVALALSATLQQAQADTFGSGVNTFDIEFVTIGNPGNAADTTGAPNPAGSVPYTYRMGKFEISEQMIDKANAEGGLGITKLTRGPDKPATRISWNEAARFINWLNTTSGSMPAYKFAIQPGEAGYIANVNIELWTTSDAGYDANNLYRNSLARYFLPSVDEWYKAAYYDPTSGAYYNYPTGSDTAPDGIDFAGDPNFDAVFNDGYDQGGPNDITNVGVFSPYGTGGQGGNVREFEETDYVDLVNGPTFSSDERGLRGGYWDDNSGILLSSVRSFAPPLGKNFLGAYGFRVASIAVPEPSTLLLLSVGSLAALWRRRGLVCAAILAAAVSVTFANNAAADTFGSGANSFDIEFVTIGNPGNAADTTGNPNPAGSVPYTYRMGKFEISEQMIDKGNNEGGLGITKDTSGPDKPATSVSWNEAARFVNWLNTSTGSLPAYKFAFQPGEVGYSANHVIQSWATSDAGYNPNNLYRNALARYFLPSMDEWYKAAYYDPTTGVYYDYPTGSDTAPTAVPSGTAPGTAVYGQVGPADITLAGGLSPYGTMGQGGNVHEWNETDFDLVNGPSISSRVARGGNWSGTSNGLLSSSRLSLSPLYEDLSGIGFRVVSIPEPSTLLLLCVGSLAALWRRRSLVCASILAAAFSATFADRADADTFGSGVNTFDIEFVSVGNPGNAADTTGNPNPAGSVPYAYRMGKFEISEQMIDKANAEGLLGITKDTRGPDKPATSVSWNEAARFVNWLNTTSNSTPAYKFAIQLGEAGYSADTNIELWTIGDAGYNPNNLYRNSLARYFLPSVDEWYKAAYFDPSSGIYYNYPTGSNSVPDGIDFAGDPNFDAVFFDGGLNPQPNDITNVGVLSPYGTAGQGGNVWEWEETDIDLVNDSSSSARGIRGGGRNSDSVNLLSSSRDSNFPIDGFSSIGFRVASIVIPEPSTLLLLCLGSLAVLWRRRRIVCASILIVLLASPAPTAHAGEIRTVALSGQQAPNTPGGVNYNTFGRTPALNDAGQVAFYANVTGGSGIWSEGSGSLGLVARSGSQAPDTPSGTNFFSFADVSLVLNDVGETTFFAILVGSGGGVDSTNNQGIWSEGAGSLALVARRGDHAPGTPGGVTYNNIRVNPLTLNNAGQNAFLANLSGGGVDANNNTGIWSEGSGSLALVALSGQQAAGTPSGVNYRFTSGSSPPVLNDAGRIAFWAELTGSGVDSTNDGGIWSEGNGSFALVAREGDHAPGTSAGVNFSRFGFGSIVLNKSGGTAFRATLTDGGDGIWSDGSGGVALVARSGNHAPGMPIGVNFGLFDSFLPVLNDAGQVAFTARLAGSGVDATNDRGIWSEGSGSLALVARVGDHAPGTPSGVSFVNFGGPTINALALNDAGQIAFLADVSDISRGIWATDRSGDLQLITREGDLLEVAPGDFRTIHGLGEFGSDGLGFTANTGNGDGRPSGFNNLGQVAFWARFTDGTSGVFVSNRVAVPEPSTLALAAISVFGLVAGTMRRRDRGLVGVATQREPAVR